MLLAFTGLHSAGKSYFVSNVPEEYGFKVYNKKEIVKQLCKEQTGRDDYMAWYGERFEKNPVEMTSLIINRLPLNEDVVLDAVHSNLEWEIIKQLVPESYLILIVTLDSIRKERWNLRGENIEMDVANKKRVNYWHNIKGDNQCLLQYVDWAFNGGSSIETNKLSFEDFIASTKRVHKRRILERNL